MVGGGGFAFGLAALHDDHEVFGLLRIYKRTPGSKGTSHNDRRVTRAHGGFVADERELRVVQDGAANVSLYDFDFADGWFGTP